MFFLKNMEHSISLHPSYFGPKMQEVIVQKLYEDVEGTVTGQDGYIIAITTLHNLPTLQNNSRVVYSTGEAQFQISYQALVMKPLKGEVVDATVEKAGKLGFFCRVGAMQVFVSGFYIPNDFTFQPEANPPAWVSNQSEEALKRGVKVRVKIIGMRPEQAGLYAIGSIKGDYLGVQD